MRAAPRKDGISAEEGSPGNYSANGLQPVIHPGGFQARILKETTALRSTKAANSRRWCWAKRGEPWFYAAGRKIYFERVPDQFLIAVEGANAARITDDVLGRRQMNRVQASNRKAESPTPPDSSFVRVSALGAKTPVGQAMLDVTRDLEKSGLTVTPALIVKRGEGPVQGLTNELIVKFADGVSEREVSQIAKERGF